MRSWAATLALASVLAGFTAASAQTTDFDVRFIERLPRYNYNASKNRPAAGDAVTFQSHVRLWSSAAVASVPFRWQIDGATVSTGTMSNLNPGEDRVVACPWTWQNGAHTVRFSVDPDNLTAERSELNNAIEDRIDGIIVGFWVEQSLYDYFAQHQPSLPGTGSASWDDWAQRQMRYWNQFSGQAIYPTTPDGVLDRVRIDKIVIVPDGALPLNGGLASNNPDLSDRTVDLMWGFPSTGLSGTFYSNHTSTAMSNPFYYEGSLLHELGHARYLIDTYGFDVHNTSSHHAVQIYEGSTYVAGSSYMPFVAFGEVLHYNNFGKMMSGGYDEGWSEYDAGALNRIAGQRALCGNYNAPCNIGVFVNDLPQRNHLRVVDQNGVPRRGAGVRVYQAIGDPGWYGKTIDNTPDLFFTTDASGYAHLPRNPFSSDVVRHTYGIANGVIILRIEHSGHIWYRFQEVTDFNIQFWRGNTQDAYYSLALTGSHDVPGDFNHDGKVNDLDFAHMYPCMTGAGIATSTGCSDADLDPDSDVDQSDFGMFQRCWSGDLAANPACG